MKVMEFLPDMDTDKLRVITELVKAFRPLANKSDSERASPEYAEALKSALSKMNEAVLDAQAEALASQQVQSRQAAKIYELEQRIAEFDSWETEKARYKLVKGQSSTSPFTYRLREDATEGEPIHHLCPRCFQHSQKSILQQTDIQYMEDKLYCPECDKFY